MRSRWLVLVMVLGVAHLLSLVPVAAHEFSRPQPIVGDGLIEVTIRGDRGRDFPMYSTGHWGRHGGSHRRYYVEAARGERYSVEVRNRTGQRIAVLIAVDGRNIISGQKSYLVRSNESMYLLDPYDVRTYAGWRTTSDQVNRFYFTDAGNSYAGAWGDVADTGVIAVAAFRERRPPPPPVYYDEGRGPHASLKSPSPAAQRSGVSAEMKSRERDDRAGTGYGETTYSPSRVVEFEPEPYPADKVFIKYEWPEVLERQGIISDRHDHTRPDHQRPDIYAPKPPGRY